MANLAYVRVSDATKQDSSNQRHVIDAYAKENNLNISKWAEFHLSGSKTSAKERGIDALLANLSEGDQVLVADIARLGRDSVHQLLNTITTITTKGATLHLCYSKTTIAPEDTNDIAKVFVAIGEAFAAVKFAEERSHKAKAACERRSKQGLHNGRKKGAQVASKLDEHATFIIDELRKGTAKTKLLSKLKERGITVTRSRLYSWINDRLDGLGIEQKTTKQ
ncbi:recombinase family protein [Vibrio parahaemolyticus]|nr:recombinase family protein [Vibrio parahaemolyticus]HCH1216498.1 recombinase family protein [Vibrio parahaemolyticus]